MERLRRRNDVYLVKTLQFGHYKAFSHYGLFSQGRFFHLTNIGIGSGTVEDRSPPRIRNIDETTRIGETVMDRAAIVDACRVEAARSLSLSINNCQGFAKRMAAAIVEGEPPQLELGSSFFDVPGAYFRFYFVSVFVVLLCVLLGFLFRVYV